MNKKYIYSMNNVSKIGANSKYILKDISLSFFDGAKIGILGLNGSGKSTLLKIMAGLDTEIIGETSNRNGVTIGFLPQEPKLDKTKDVRGNIEQGLSHLKDMLIQFDEINIKFSEKMSNHEIDELLNKQGELQNAIDSAGAWEIDRKLEVAAEALRLPEWNTDVTKLSGGEVRRVALCKLLLSNPDILLLDEPTNHLDAESVEWLEKFLLEYKGTIVTVTHDRYFLDNVAEWILELDRGVGIPFKGNYTQWLEQKEKRLKIEEKQETNHCKALKHELDWIRQNAKGSQIKSKARLNQFDKLNSQEFQKRNETKDIYIPPGERLGKNVIKVKDIVKSFDNRLLINKLNMEVAAGSIVGIIGPNGTGKSTYFKMITGKETPDSGEIKLGQTVNLAYVDQSRDDLDDNKTVWEEISDGLDIINVGKYKISSRKYVGQFNFKGADQQKYIYQLSGGERNRVHLAKILKIGGNVILLDEPSNDLDVETLRLLEEAILTFPGCIMVISHDRWFLNRIATHILAFEGNSKVIWFKGNYNDYIEDKKNRLDNLDDNISKMKYRKISVN